MSSPLFHASLSFTAAALILRASGMPGELAFAAAILSVVIDLDQALSPNARFERCCHSPLFLAIAWAFLPLLMMIGIPLQMALIPGLAASIHIGQDILHGEQVSVSFSLPPSTYRPKAAQTVDLVSLPLSLMAMLL